jgi:hypothetical protein
MAYLTFKEYTGMGGSITDAAAFNRCILRATATISRMTHNRVADETPVRPAVQYAAFDLVNAIYADGQNGAEGREIASMSNDGVSVSFVDGGCATAAQRHSAIVRSYLEHETDRNGTLLLYAGVDA